MRKSLWILPFLVLAPLLSQAQIKGSQLTQVPKPTPSRWHPSIYYGISSDLADSRTPRSYNHLVGVSTEYMLAPDWSLNWEGGLRYEVINGQIPKGQEQSETEVLNPSTSLGIDFHRSFFQRHRYSLFASGEPLFAEESRLEGHKGLMSAGGSVRFSFFNRRYTMSHSIVSTGLINTYKYSSDLTANPDYFYTYSFNNSIKFLRTFKFGAGFGMKVTRYLDGFVGYSYGTRFSLSNSWRNLTASIAYENGGFTDDGYVDLWYLDQYRRIFRLTVSYAF
ncbi:MAG: hypothetical protein AB7F86_19665 [Bdellovibrionales bacterium]